MTEQSQAVVKPAKQKPMTVTERKALMTLIDNDFSVLRSQIRMYADELRASEERRIRAEFTELEELGRTAEAEWSELRRGLQTQVDEFMGRWRDRGLTSKVIGTSRYDDGTGGLALSTKPMEFVPRERDRALTDIKNQIERQQMTALNELERQRIVTQREVLTSAIVSEEARTLLDKQPDPKDLLDQAVNGVGVNPLAIRAVAVQQIEGRVVAPPVEVVDVGVHIPEVMDR